MTVNCILCGRDVTGRLVQASIDGPICLPCWEATDSECTAYQQALEFLGYDERTAGEPVESTI